MSSFVITNLSSNSVTYQGVTIAPGASYTTPTNSTSFATDLGLLADLIYGNVKITINSTDMLGSEAVEALHVAACWPTPLYKNITGNSTITIKDSPGILTSMIINNSNTGGTITIYDNTSATGTVIGTYQIGTPSGGLLSTTGLCNPCLLSNLNMMFTTGLTVVTAGSSNNNVTIYYF